MVAIGVTDTIGISVIVFSKNYLPLGRVNLKRAVILLLTGKAETMNFVSEVVWEVRSPSIVLQVPAYIRLNHGTERVWKVPPVSRREILKRDRHQCQYCGSKKQLTIDHVIPRSKGGKHSWDNVVIACSRCNSCKGDRTPEQVGMLLKTKPKAPAHPSLAFAEAFWQAAEVQVRV
jgi:5-methylcytosine-specific restriction endonuclease McrA